MSACFDNALRTLVFLFGVRLHFHVDVSYLVVVQLTRACISYSSEGKCWLTCQFSKVAQNLICHFDGPRLAR